MIKHLATALLTLIIATGCSSLVDKGDKMYEEGMYQEAAAFYEQALTGNPNDEEALMGLKKARDMIIDRGLIQVRMMRLGSNQAGAALKLESILRNQKAWNIEILGAVASTQEEETEHAEKWLKKEAEVLSNDTQPDKFKWFMYAYSHLIANARLEQSFKPYETKLQGLGEQKCQALKNAVSGQRFYLKDFVTRYCQSWGVHVALTTDKTDQSRFSILNTTQRINIRTNANRNQKITFNTKLNSLKDDFKDSLWFSSLGATPLDMKVSGKIKYRRTSAEEKRTKKYTVKEKVELADGKTETRKVKKKHAYTVTVYNENYSIDLVYNSKVGNVPVNKNFTNNENHKAEGHDVEFKPAKIYPQKPRFMDLNQELSTQMDKANSALINELKTLWVSHYCHQGLGEQQGENILRCGKAKPEQPFVNNWFTREFGVDYVSMAEMFGL